MTTFLLSLLACPNCKDALDERLSLGFAISIGLMMLVPVTLFIGWSIAIYWLSTKSNPT